MYQPFTERARKAMALADQQAHDAGHEYVGSEHILLGLLEEETGVGAIALYSFDLHLRDAVAEFKKLVKRGNVNVDLPSRPLTPRAKKVVGYAIEESRALNHNYVGTEHLLLGVLREVDGIAVQILKNLIPSIDLHEVRRKVLSLIGAAPS